MSRALLYTVLACALAPLKKVRQSTEYREVLAEVNEEVAKDIAEAGKNGKAKVCKQIIQNL